MLTLRPATVYLDEVGHIYLPLLGPGRACLRLNAAASALWRRWTREPVDAGSLDENERRLLEDLQACGALTLVQAHVEHRTETT